MTGKGLPAIVLWVMVTAAPAPAQDRSGDGALAAAATRVEAIVAPHAEAGLLSGVLLVARGDRVVFERAYGFADWETRAPNAATTRFGIASITKPMTATLVRLLSRERRIDLNAPIEAYMPGFPRGPDGIRPTISHLLSHRAGVPHRVTDPVEETLPLGAAAVVDRVREAGLLFEPGSRRLYSSAGYTCLARIVEVVENAPFADVLARRIFEPAGMTRAISETGQGLMAGRAEPYRLGADEGRVVVKHAPYKDLRFLTGAGSVYLTARDLLAFVRAVRDGVFGEELAAEAFEADDPSWQGWAGRTNGYEASVDVLTSPDLTFVFLSNLQSASNWQVRERIRNILAGRRVEPVPLPPPVAERFEDPETLVGSFGPAEIRLVDGRMFRGDNEFYPIEGDRYYIPASGTVMRFRRDSAGAVDAIVSIGGDGEERILPRSEAPGLPDSEAPGGG